MKSKVAELMCRRNCLHASICCCLLILQLKKKYPDVRSLRGVTLEQLDAVKGSLKDVEYR